MNIIDLETPKNTEKYYAPKCENEEPFFITEYGKTLKGIPCYQLRMESMISTVQYVISGSGVIMCDDEIYTVNAGDSFLLPEGKRHIYYSNADNQFERIWLNFKGELAKELRRIYGISKTTVFKNTDILEIMESIQESCKGAKSAEEYKNESALLFLKLVQKLSEAKKTDDTVPSALEEIRLYIDCHITENLKLSTIAKETSFSVEHIIRSFKENYGITPHQYIIQSKIRLAMIMLKTTDSSIEEISEKLSFSDPRHFSMQFTKHVGSRPSVYRKSFGN